MANWNIDWATRVGEPLFKASAADDAQYNFGRAVEERYFGSITFFSSGAEGDNALAFVNGPGSSDSGIAAAEAAPWALADKWLLPGYDPDGNRFFNTISFRGNNDGTVTLGDSYVIRRRWRRRIWSTANAGSSGQRAVLEDHRPLMLDDGVTFNTKGLWYAVDDGDAAFATYVTTPDAQRKYSGKLFDHNGTTWVLSSDQSTPADIVTQTDSNRWYPGTIIHGSDLNELRDRINDMAKTWAVADPNNDGSAGNADATMRRFSTPLSSTPPSSVAGSLATANNQNRFAVSFVSAADADTLYNAASPSAGGKAMMIKTRSGTAPSESWSNERGESEIATASAHLPDTGQNREVYYYVWAVLPTAAVGAAQEFDAYGDGVVEQRWHFLGSGQQTTDEVDSGADGVQAGTVAGTAPSPWPSGTDTARGWELKDVGIVVDWTVSSGFTYSAASGF